MTESIEPNSVFSTTDFQDALSFLSLKEALSISGIIHLNKAIPWLWEPMSCRIPARTPAHRRRLEKQGNARFPASCSGPGVLTPQPFLVPFRRPAGEAAAFISCLFKVITTCISSLLVLLERKRLWPSLHYTK